MASALGAFGDRNGDGVRDLAAGAPFDDDGGLDHGAVWSLALDGIAALDFQTEGDLSTPLVDGHVVRSPQEFAGLVGLASSGANRGLAVFDSTPGGPNDPSQDPDLLVGTGNVLILQNSSSPTQTVPEIYDHPNDDQDGAEIVFSFATPVEPLQLELIDIDSGAEQSASVTLTDTSGRTRVYSVPAAWTGDRVSDGTSGRRVLDLRTLAPQPGFHSTATAVESGGVSARAVIRLEVQLGSSGAVDGLCFDSHPD